LPDALILAEADGPCDGKAERMQGGNDPVLAVDGMGGFQQLAGWFAAQDVRPSGRVDAIGRVRLATLELGHRHGAFEIFDILAHPGFERGFIEAVGVPDCARAGECI